MPYIIQKKGELVTVPVAAVYIYKGTQEECEAFLKSSPKDKEEARARQLKFLKDLNHGRGWRKGIKGRYRSQVR